ncbi:sugar transporter [Aestuariibius insulae]|uniref:sugar transporter n=1 Tax=Aestuariibius insulae TaxID=2058287 RepID=UPI0034702DD3
MKEQRSQPQNEQGPDDQPDRIAPRIAAVEDGKPLKPLKSLEEPALKAIPPAPAAEPGQKLAARATMKRRHYGAILSFLLIVLLPIGGAAYYLYEIAKEQYASTVGFAVQTEDMPSAVELLGGITELGGSSSSSDTDILYEFIQSQEMVRLIDEQLDLSSRYVAEEDPVFSMSPDAKIEEMTDYWQRMVKVFYDGSSGLIEIRVHAFSPEDATAIANAIFDESNRMINEMSAIARDDATRYAAEELERASQRLKEARQVFTQFQTRTRIVDPQADVVGQMTVMNTLQTQLVSTQIELDLLLATTNSSDPRIQSLERRIDAISDRIEAEKRSLVESDNELDNAYSELLGEYEALAVDKEFAQATWLSASASYDAAQAEAVRTSRYLANYIGPTLAETSQYPRRTLILLLISGALFMSWAILTLVFYSLRDRK